MSNSKESMHEKLARGLRSLRLKVSHAATLKTSEIRVLLDIHQKTDVELPEFWYNWITGIEDETISVTKDLKRDLVVLIDNIVDLTVNLMVKNRGFTSLSKEPPALTSMYAQRFTSTWPSTKSVKSRVEELRNENLQEQAFLHYRNIPVTSNLNDMPEILKVHRELDYRKLAEIYEKDPSYNDLSAPTISLASYYTFMREVSGFKSEDDIHDLYNWCVLSILQGADPNLSIIDDNPTKTFNYTDDQALEKNEINIYCLLSRYGRYIPRNMREKFWELLMDLWNPFYNHATPFHYADKEGEFFSPQYVDGKEVPLSIRKSKNIYFDLLNRVISQSIKYNIPDGVEIFMNYLDVDYNNALTRLLYMKFKDAYLIRPSDKQKGTYNFPNTNILVNRYFDLFEMLIQNGSSVLLPGTKGHTTLSILWNLRMQYKYYTKWIRMTSISNDLAPESWLNNNSLICGMKRQTIGGRYDVRYLLFEKITNIISKTKQTEDNKMSLFNDLVWRSQLDEKAQRPLFLFRAADLNFLHERDSYQYNKPDELKQGTFEGSTEQIEPILNFGYFDKSNEPSKIKRKQIRNETFAFMSMMGLLVAPFGTEYLPEKELQLRYGKFNYFDELIKHYVDAHGEAVPKIFPKNTVADVVAIIVTNAIMPRNERGVIVYPSRNFNYLTDDFFNLEDRQLWEVAERMFGLEYLTVNGGTFMSVLSSRIDVENTNNVVRSLKTQNVDNVTRHHLQMIKRIAEVYRDEFKARFYPVLRQKVTFMELIKLGRVSFYLPNDWKRNPFNIKDSRE